jgi:hypothetical protein
MTSPLRLSTLAGPGTDWPQRGLSSTLYLAAPPTSCSQCGRVFDVPCLLRFYPTVVHSLRQHPTYRSLRCSCLKTHRLACPLTFTFHAPRPRVKPVIDDRFQYSCCSPVHVYCRYSYRYFPGSRRLWIVPLLHKPSIDCAAHRRHLPRSHFRLSGCTVP